LRRAEIYWYEAHGIGKVRHKIKVVRVKTTRKTRKRFALCIENQDCDDLEVGKVYRILPDKVAAGANHVRVVDESGEDYLYPASSFVFVELPSKAERALAAARRRAAGRTA
jgi:hypothetical protein